jgi:hypothetical protein
MSTRIDLSVGVVLLTRILRSLSHSAPAGQAEAAVVVSAEPSDSESDSESDSDSDSDQDAIDDTSPLSRRALKAKNWNEEFQVSTNHLAFWEK